MSVVIPDEILQSARMNESEIKQEIALMLYQKRKVSLPKAARFAGMHRMRFQQLLAQNKIPLDYDVDDLRDDLKTSEKIGL